MSVVVPPCAGVVVLRWTDGEPECLLVATHSGQWGFPKGKRERGESVAANALRELREETGLAPEHVALHEAVAEDERSDRGNLAVRYLAATLRDGAPAPVAAPDEHAAVAWVPVAKALALLRPSRREVLRRVVARVAPAP